VTNNRLEPKRGKDDVECVLGRERRPRLTGVGIVEERWRTGAPVRPDGRGNGSKHEFTIGRYNKNGRTGR